MMRGYWRPRFVLSPREATRWFLAYLVVLGLGLVMSYMIEQPLNVLSPGAGLRLTVMNITGVSIFAFAILYYFVQQRDLAFRLLRGERERSEDLLLNILPKDIVAVLKNSPQTIANQFDGATILFADVVNFTPLAATMAPTQLVELLNQVFSYFDSLVDKYEVEKIKTIGDCYMVAAGVPRPRPDHAHVMTRLALEMRDYVEQHEFGGHRLVLRIGLNSGPVVAGVGQKTSLRPLGRRGEHGEPDGVPRKRRNHPDHGGDVRSDRRGFYLRAARHDRRRGKGEMEVWQVLR
jgi:guanylate cyclase